MHINGSMAKKKKIPELDIPQKDRESYDEYKKKQERKLKELEYENQNGYYPPKPWYEE